jgi:hypothetical protein
MRRVVGVKVRQVVHVATRNRRCRTADLLLMVTGRLQEGKTTPVDPTSNGSHRMMSHSTITFGEMILIEMPIMVVVETDRRQITPGETTTKEGPVRHSTRTITVEGVDHSDDENE